LIVRTGIVTGTLGAADAERHVRGFAVKFHTETSAGTRRQQPAGICKADPD